MSTKMHTDLKVQPLEEVPQQSEENSDGGVAYFKTNTLLKNLVGKDLINDDNIAIVELVKNSYDAQSEDVEVRFTEFVANKDSKVPDNFESTPNSQIIILDKGSGMSLSDIKDKWLNIAYSEKKLVEQDNGAYLAGNKGIGRFSCDRLGAVLDLVTCKAGGELLHLRINWMDFEIEGEKDLTIQQIRLYIRPISEHLASDLVGVLQFPDHGTALVISELRSVWSRERLRDLKTDLEKFLNPNQLFLRNRFKIHLLVPAMAKLEEGKDYSDRVTGEVQNQIFDKLKFNTTYIETKVSDDNETLNIVIYHEGEKVLDLTEHNKSYRLLKGTYVVIYYLNPYKKAYFKRQTGVRSVDFGSIFLFLNGFRIAPYGDRGDDWLGLDVRKAQGTARYLSSRDIVGRIEITGSEEQFKPISSREGLKKTPAFEQLKDEFFLDMLRKLEKFVVDGLDWDSVPRATRDELRNSEGLNWEDTAEQYVESWERKKQRIALSIMTFIGSSPELIVNFWFNPALLDGIYETRKEEVNKLLAEIEGINPEKIDEDLTTNLTKFRKLIVEKEEEIAAAKTAAADLRVEVAQQEQKISKLQDETETYRAQTLFFQQVTSLDVKQLMAYHHQINLDSTIVGNYIAKAIKELRVSPNSSSILDSLQKASLANKRIAAIAQYATKANFRSATKKELTDIPAFFEQYLLRVATDFIATGLKLEVNNSVQELFEINASRIELSILVDNIISNAIKAHAKKLQIIIVKTSTNSLRISFIDDGRGLSKDLPDANSMFEIGITTTAGSGLGLYHAQSIVEKIGGQISAIPRNPSGMEIRIEVTR